MPGFTTHYLFGVNNLKQIKKKNDCQMLVHSIERYKTVFQLGLQGPDIFFYHPASQMRRVRPGSVVHTRWTGDFMKCLIEAPELFWKEEDRQIARAYAAGFIGHYILDTQMHPYVYYRTGVGVKLKQRGYARHIELETDIDSRLLMRYAGCLPSEFAYGRTIDFGRRIRSVVSMILFHAYNTIFPELSLTKGFLSRAICSMQIGTKLTYNPHNYKRLILGKIEKVVFGRLEVSPVIPTDYLKRTRDPLNLQQRQWHNPWDTKAVSQMSVPQMIKKASGRYQKALRQLNHLYKIDPFEPAYDKRLEELYQFLGQQSFHSGLDWTLGE